MSAPRAATETHMVAGNGPEWVRDATFYQVFPDRFCNADPTNDPAGTVSWDEPPTYDNFFGGDLRGILEKLPYLEELGINALYLTPIFKAGTNHRYDTHDYLAVDPALGDDALLRALVQDAHARGIRVILDGVFNHCGDGFWAFRDLERYGAESRYRDWFVVRDLPIVRGPPSYQTCGGTPYLPKLNTANRETREHLLSVATHWIEQAEIDGWRLDVPWKAPLDFWHDFRARVKQARPDAYLVGEAWWSWGELRHVFDGLMNYRLRARLLDFCVHDTMDAEDFAIELRQLLDESDGGELMLNLLGSHDTPRLLTLAGGDEARAKLALCALFTLPGTPMIYYGDEVGLEGGDDPDCRRPMPWNESRWRRPLHELTRRLIALRHEHAAPRRGSFDPLLSFNRVFAYRRRTADDELVVVLNAGARRHDLQLTLPPNAIGHYQDALSGNRYQVKGASLLLDDLPSRSACILVAEPGGALALR